MRRLILSLILACCIVAPAAAQITQEVYVTLQFNMAFRAGPGTNFERLSILPGGITLQAIGRSSLSDWVQVVHEDETGWLATRFLVWSGDLVSLPIDGINPDPYVRRVFVSGTTIRETRIYRRQVTPEHQIGVIPEDETVEIIGRLGSGRMYWLQILYQGQIYWVGSWDIDITNGRSGQVLDTAYLYPYGRLVSQLASDLASSTRRLQTIESIWLRLQAGERVACSSLPIRAARGISDADVRRVNNFGPLVAALDAGNVRVNRAISAFDDACNRSDAEFFIDQRDIQVQLDDLQAARQEYVIALALFDSLEAQNALFSS